MNWSLLNPRKKEITSSGFPYETGGENEGQYLIRILRCLSTLVGATTVSSFPSRLTRRIGSNTVMRFRTQLKSFKQIVIRLGATQKYYIFQSFVIKLLKQLGFISKSIMRKGQRYVRYAYFSPSSLCLCGKKWSSN